MLRPSFQPCVDGLKSAAARSSFQYAFVTVFTTVLFISTHLVLAPIAPPSPWRFRKGIAPVAGAWRRNHRTQGPGSCKRRSCRAVRDACPHRCLPPPLSGRHAAPFPCIAPWGLPILRSSTPQTPPCTNDSVKRCIRMRRRWAYMLLMQAEERAMGQQHLPGIRCQPALGEVPNLLLDGLAAIPGRYLQRNRLSDRARDPHTHCLQNS